MPHKLIKNTTYYENTNRLIVLNSLQDFLAAMTLPYPEMVVRISEIYAYGGGGFGSVYIGFGIAYRPLIRAPHEAHMREIVHLEMMRAIIGIELYRNKHDRLPERLDDALFASFEPKPRDPYSGLHFHYRKLARGYTVYSVGANQVDDRGVHYDEHVTQLESGDWPLMVAR